jgi:putative ABC transport system permease protein
MKNASFGSAMSLLIAWRNLVHDKVRFIVTLIGIIFSVILIGFQLGLLLNFIDSTRTVVENSHADIWITGKHVQAFDLPTPIDKRWKHAAMAVEGVKKVEGMLVNFSVWKRPDGRRESVSVIGLEPDATMGKPWSIVEGLSSNELLKYHDAITVDKLYQEKLQANQLNQSVEVNGIRSRLMAYTYGVRTFSLSPNIFTNLDQARAILGGMAPSSTYSYLLIKAMPGIDISLLKNTLQENMPDVDVFTTKEFADQTTKYWIISTGAGASLIMSAILGLFVGGVIVAQTLYATTMDRIREYSTLRAMGTPKSYLTAIIVKQALMGGAIGYLIGMSVTLIGAYLTKDAQATPLLPLWLIGFIAICTLITCLVASAVSLKRVFAIDPMGVFR